MKYTQAQVQSMFEELAHLAEIAGGGFRVGEKVNLIDDVVVTMSESGAHQEVLYRTGTESFSVLRARKGFHFFKRNVPVVVLPDGYQGHLEVFFKAPIEDDGKLVKLQCATPGRQHLIRWALR